MKNQKSINKKIIFILGVISLLPLIINIFIQISNTLQLQRIKNNAFNIDKILVQELETNKNTYDIKLETILKKSNSNETIRNILILSNPENKLLLDLRGHNKDLINPYIKLNNEMLINKNYCKSKYGIFYNLFFNKTFYEPDFYYLSDVYQGDEILKANSGKVGFKIRHNLFYLKSFSSMKSLYYIAIPHTVKERQIITLIETEFFDNQKIKLILYLSSTLSILIALISFPILFLFITKPLLKINEDIMKEKKLNNYHISQNISYQNSNNEFGDIAKAYKILSEKTNHKISDIEKYAKELSKQFLTPIGNISKLMEQKESFNTEDLNLIISNSNKMDLIISKLRQITKIKNKNDNELSEVIPVDIFIKNFITSLNKSNNSKILFNGNSKKHKIFIPTLHFELILTELIRNGLENNNYIEISTNIKRINKFKFVQIKIEDSGLGIPKENEEYIFNNFYTNWKNDKNHLGLGLPLVKAIVHSHNGSISLIKDKKLKGACFLISLPLASNKEIIK